MDSEPGNVRRAARLNVRNDYAFLPIEIKALRKVRGYLLQVSADDYMMDMAELAKFSVDKFDDSAGDRETKALASPLSLSMKVLIPTMLPSVSTSGPRCCPS